MASDNYSVKMQLQRYATNHRAFVTHHTADATLVVSQSGSIHTNLGAEGTVTLTLPQNADKGVYFTFAVMAAQELRIDPGDAGAIYHSGEKLTDSYYIGADDEGEHVTLVCDGNHDWFPVSIEGTWTAQS